MENFDNLDPIDDFFKGSLRAAGQGEKPAPGEWESLESMLKNAAPKPMPNQLVLGAMGLSLLISLAANTWFFSKWRDTGKEVGLLKTEFSEIKSMLAESSIGVEKHEQVTLFDTVYRTIVVRKTIFLDEKIQGSGPVFSKNKGIRNLPENGNSITETMFVAKNDGNLADPKPAERAENTEPTAQKSPALNYSFMTENGFSDFMIDSLNQLLTENKYKDAMVRAHADSIAAEVKTLAGRFDSLMQVRAQPVVPQRCPRPSYRVLGGFSSQKIYGIEGLSTNLKPGVFLGGEAQFGRHFTVGAMIGFANLKFEQSQKFDPRLLIAEPVSLGSEYEFYKIEGQQRMFLPEITAGFRFFSLKNWSPRLTAGWGWRFLKTGEAEYEFKNKLTGDEFEVSVEQPGWQGRGQQLSLRAGIERRLAGRVWAFGDAGALFDFGQGQRGATVGLARLGLAVGL